MSREKTKCIVVAWLKLAALAFLNYFLPYVTCSEEAIPLHATPTVKQFFAPYKNQYKTGYFNTDHHSKQKGSELIKRFQSEKIFQIEPSDAIDIAKYSQPAFLDPQINSSPSNKVPSMTISNAKIFPLSTQYSKSTDQEKITVFSDVPKQNISKPMRDLRFIETVADKTQKSSSLGEEYLLRDEKLYAFQSDMGLSVQSNLSSQSKNFTDSEVNLLPVSSNAVLSYQTAASSKEKDNLKNKDTYKISTEQDSNVSSHSEKPMPPISDAVVPSTLSSSIPILSTETAILFDTHHIEVLNQTDSLENAFSTAIIPSIHDEANFSSDTPLLDNGKERLSSGTVAGIVIAVLVCVTILSSTVIYLLYRKYNGKCTSVVDSKFNTDNCGYLDDSLRSSIYLNNHIELPKESSEEMSSLDNDSFLNSLETMTIQNYWADNSKNTKV